MFTYGKKNTLEDTEQELMRLRGMDEAARKNYLKELDLPEKLFGMDTITEAINILEAEVALKGRGVQYRLKFKSFPAGRYLSSYCFKSQIPVVESTNDPNEALVFYSKEDVNSFLSLTSFISERLQIEEDDSPVLY